MNRLSEFKKLTDSLSLSNAIPTSSNPLPTPPLTKPLQNVSTNSTLKCFHTNAANISLQIHNTSSKLTQLTSLVSRKSLFNDKTDQINRLVFSIKVDIDDLNKNLEDASRFVSEKKSTLTSSSKQVSNHTDNVMGELKTEVLAATKEFKTVLDRRSHVLKETNDRKKTFGGDTGKKTNALLLGKPKNFQAQQLHHRHRHDAARDDGGDPGGLRLVALRVPRP